VSRQLLDRRRREYRARVPDHSQNFRGARAGRQAAQHSDRSPPGDERTARDSMTFASLNRRTEQLLRDLAPQVLSATLRRFRDFAACEDAVQEALIAAASQWPRD